MDARSIISALRDGRPPSREELAWFARGLADGNVSDSQAGAFAMCVLLKGLCDEGRVGLTLAMRDSGARLDWDLDGPVIDKHSTGGIGDCVSLVLAPALAACGAYVPMISGRGLGHTGGTLDKLEAIPGLRTDVGEEKLRRLVAENGCVIVGASTRIAPADRRLYAVRDVTGTVESLDLITASILSKKLAAGLSGLVLDVKTGSGAFMKSVEDARRLAAALTGTARGAGCPAEALVSDMNQPLAPAVGNALEVAAAMRVLTGSADGALRDLSVELGAMALCGAGLADGPEEGRAAIGEVIADGKAAECFGRMVAALGGPTRFIQDWARFLPEATVIREMPAPRDGYVAEIDGTEMGLAVIGLGGGRQVERDPTDPAVGLSDVLPLGTHVTRGQPLLRIHAARVGQADRAEAQLGAAIRIDQTPPELPPLVHGRMR